MKIFLKIIVFVVVVLLFGDILLAQEKTDFTAWKEPKNAAVMPDLVRRMLVRDFRDMTGESRKQRLEEYLLELQNIAADANVVPTARYNTILAIGQLVSEEAMPGNLPKTYPAALLYLVDAYKNPEFPAYLKYGALLGIVRHANCGIDKTQRENVIDLLLNTVKEEHGMDEMLRNSDFAVPFEPAIWDWFRQTALDGLSALKTTGVDGKVVTELLTVCNQKSQELENLAQNLDLSDNEAGKQIRQTLELASKVAKTLGDLDYQSAKDIDAKAITDSFVRLCKAASLVEQKIATAILTQSTAQPNAPVLIGQIVIDLKTCTQSVAWGIRGAFLSGKPTDNSLYYSLQDDEKAAKRLDDLWTALNDLAVFFDEGSKANPQTSASDPSAAKVLGKGFKYELPELRDTLAKFSETLAKI